MRAYRRLINDDGYASEVLTLPVYRLSTVFIDVPSCSRRKGHYVLTLERAADPPRAERPEWKIRCLLIRGAHQGAQREQKLRMGVLSQAP
jgi:hypothetical protein